MKTFNFGKGLNFSIGNSGKDDCFDRIIFNSNEILLENISESLRDVLSESDIKYIFSEIDFENSLLLASYVNVNDGSNIFKNKPDRSARMREIIPYLDRFKDRDVSIKNAYDMIFKEYNKSVYLRKSLKPIRGFVYLIKAKNKLYKIGKTKDINKRMSPFSVSFPMKWKLIYSFQTDDYTSVEIYLHKIFQIKEKLGNGFSYPTKMLLI